jgi:hypothetical protein
MHSGAMPQKMLEQLVLLAKQDRILEMVDYNVGLDTRPVDLGVVDKPKCALGECPMRTSTPSIALQARNDIPKLFIDIVPTAVHDPMAWPS